MAAPRVVDLPGYRVVKLRYAGPPPPATPFLDHWQRFNVITNRLRLASRVPEVQAIGYAPPDLAPDGVLVYDACLPVGEDVAGEHEDLELGNVPGGRYVLCAGPITELPLLLEDARRYAMSHGLAIERGRIEIYRPIPPDADLTPVDVGYRIHD